MLIKSAAVPHFSKANGKIYYAVRVCPANIADEPYTIYRRWDDFLDFSQKLASVFPANTPEPDADEPNTNNAAAQAVSFIRRVPRLSKRVVLFVTASTHASRRDELDLFVRQLFSLSRAVTSFPLVREFFAIRSNGMDGKLPPSPTFASQFENAVAVGRHGEGGAAGQQQQQHRHAYASIRERSPTIETVFYPPAGTMRPSLALAGKRSTPDLRRFMHASGDLSDVDNASPRPSPSPRSFRFPAHAQGRVNTAPASPAAGTASIRECLAPFELDDLLQRSAPTSPVRMGTTGAYIGSSGSGSGSDTASTRTASTVRPTVAGAGASRTSSRIASPLSFDSAISSSAEQSVEDGLGALCASLEEQKQGTKNRPTPGALKHFRSLQDIRTVVSPRPVLAGHVARPSLSIHQPARPQHHRQAQAQVHQYGAPPTHRPPPPPVTRSRSDSRILMKPLSQVAEDEPISSSSASSGPRQHGPRRSSTAKSSSTFSRNSSGTMTSKASLEDLHRRAAQMMAFTPISAPPLPNHTAGGGNRHKHTPSNSSIASTLSSLSSSSNSSCADYYLGSSTISTSSTSSSRIGTTAAGIGLGFTTTTTSSSGTSSCSLESFDFSSDRSSPIDSPNSSFGSFPVDTQGRSTATGTGTGTGRGDETFEKWQIDTVNGNFIYNNHLPPMPFFPTPGACDVLHHQQQQQKVAESQCQPQQQQQVMYSNSTARRHGRHRASSLHTPVLETILASPILGGAAAEPAPATSPKSSATATYGSSAAAAAGPNLTIKLMTSKGNYLMKVPKDSSLRQVREKVSSKCQSADIILERGFELFLCPSPSSGTAGKDRINTAKSLDVASTTITKGMIASGNATMVELQDEEDWQLALSLAKTKITLRVA